MKNTAAPAMALLLFLTSPVFGQTRENAYDVLGKVLLPIAGVLSPKAEMHGLLLDAHLVSASKLPPEFQGQPVHIALNPPDRLLLRAPIAGQTLTVCRDGDDIWAEPGSKIQYLVDQAAPSPDATAATIQPPKKKKKHDAGKDAAKALGPLRLPIPEKDLVFLPVLFEVADAGDEQIGGMPCRVLDVRLMPQLAQSLHAGDWSARIWVGANYRLSQIAITGPKWDATIAVDKLEFWESLREAAFQPQTADVLHLTKAQFIDLIGRLGSK